MHRKGSLLSNECVLERARVEGIEITRVIEVAFAVLTMLPRLMTANKGSSDLTRYHGKFSLMWGRYSSLKTEFFLFKHALLTINWAPSFVSHIPWAVVLRCACFACCELRYLELLNNPFSHFKLKPIKKLLRKKGFFYLFEKIKSFTDKRLYT